MKPRVLIVDDHRAVLDSVSALLATDFDVVGAATDGESALEASSRLEPDVVVMDIAMPGLDGFQTARRLRQNGSSAKVVFLTMHEVEEYVLEAFASGGQGFVAKTRAEADLASAVDQVFAGRLFVPSLKSLFHVADGASGHAMQIHWNSDAYINGVADLFDLALRRGDATCLIGTEPVCEGVTQRLRDRDWSIGGSGDCGRFMAVNASDALARFMRNDRPDANILAEIATELDRYRIASAGAASRITLLGEMASVLNEGGNPVAGVQLEHAWNHVTEDLPFFTVCGYSAACFDDTTHRGEFTSTCDEHWAVGHAPQGA